MRIMFNDTNIIEAYDVDVTIGGWPDETKKREFKEMNAFLYVRSEALPNDPEFDFEQVGEFDVSDCFSYDDAKNKTQKFFNDLLVNGYVDISTDEKRKSYNIILY